MEKNRNYGIRIKLDKEVDKVIRYRFGDGSDYIRLSLHSVVGQVFAASSQKIMYQHYLPAHHESGGILFEFAGNELTGRFLPSEKVPRVKRLLYYIVLEELRVTCEAFRGMGQSDYNAVKFFCAKYGITENDIAQETLRKRIREWERKIAEKNVKKSSALLGAF